MVEGMPAILQYGGIGLAAIVVLLWYLYIRDQQARDIKRDEYLQGLVNEMLRSTGEYIDIIHEISKETVTALNAVANKVNNIGTLMQRSRHSCDEDEQGR